MSSQNLTTEEFEKVKTFEDMTSQLIQELGVTTYNAEALNRKVRQLADDIDKVVQDKNKFYQELRESYGDGSIDLEKGLFIPNSEN